MAKPALDIEELTSEERLELIGQLWDSLDDGEVPMTEALRDELDRRLDDLDREGPVGVPWEQVRDSLDQSQVSPRSMTSPPLPLMWRSPLFQ